MLVKIYKMNSVILSNFLKIDIKIVKTSHFFCNNDSLSVNDMI